MGFLFIPNLVFELEVLPSIILPLFLLCYLINKTLSLSVCLCVSVCVCPLIGAKTYREADGTVRCGIARWGKMSKNYQKGLI